MQSPPQTCRGPSHTQAGFCPEVFHEQVLAVKLLGFDQKKVLYGGAHALCGSTTSRGHHSASGGVWDLVKVQGSQLMGLGRGQRDLDWH